MNADATDGGREALEVPHRGDLAFMDLMDALAPDEPEDQAETPAGSNASAAGSTGPETVAGVADTSGGSPAQAGSADSGELPQSGGDASGSPESSAAVDGRANLPATWNVDVNTVSSQLGELNTKLEERMTSAYQRKAFEDTKQEYERYFTALEKHPRMLVGVEVPALSGEGTEILRDTADAREWQEAIRMMLVEEIKQRASKDLQEQKGFIDTLHAAIDIFKNNKDLVPGTKQFDKELADTFANMMAPYEIRVEGKLSGYSIPVQPIIDNLRKQIQTRRPVAQSKPQAPTRQAAPRRGSQPQAAIQSKAPSSGEKEDFSTLFGTIGLPNIRI